MSSGFEATFERIYQFAHAKRSGQPLPARYRELVYWPEVKRAMQDAWWTIDQLAQRMHMRPSAVSEHMNRHKLDLEKRHRGGSSPAYWRVKR